MTWQSVPSWVKPRVFAIEISFESFEKIFLRLNLGLDGFSPPKVIESWKIVDRALLLMKIHAEKFKILKRNKRVTYF